jgi:uncharacterized protein with ParB-like and HNH nuclease domain
VSRFEETDAYEYGSLIEKYKKFTVPHYQRPYSWEKKQVQDLFSDILENQAPYFVGNLVCLTPDVHEKGRLSIVDGQQRLTTISLFFAALIAKYAQISARENTTQDLKEKLDRRIAYCQTFLSAVDRSGEDDETYIILELGRIEYKEVYKAVVYQEIADEQQLKQYNINQQKIVENYREIKRLIDNRIAELSTEDAYQVLFKEIEDRLKRVQFILIVLKNQAEVFNIFEGMNSTGLDLTTSDLVKNAVLRKATEENNARIEELWNELEDIFLINKAKDFPNFLRRWYMSHVGYISNDKLFGKIKNEFIDERSEFVTLEGFVQRLIDDAKFYVRLRKGYSLDDLIPNQQLRDEFKKFAVLSNDQVYTILIAYYEYGVRQQKVSIKELKANLRNLWVFVFRSSYVSLSPSDYERQFVNHCKLLNGQPYAKSSEKLTNTQFFTFLERKSRNSDQFIENIKDSLKYNDKNRRLLYRVFTDLMQNYNPRDRAIVPDHPTVEHILPQSPEKWGYTKSGVKPIVDNLGNLTVLFSGDNTDASDETFEYKTKNVYSSSHFKFTQDICQWEKKFEADYKQAIGERAAVLAEAIDKLYRIDA